VTVVCDVRAPHPTQGLYFSGIFLHHIGHPATHPPKITKIVQGEHPSDRVKQEGGGQTGESGISISLLVYYTAIYIQLENK